STPSTWTTSPSFSRARSASATGVVSRTSSILTSSKRWITVTGPVTPAPPRVGCRRRLPAPSVTGPVSPAPPRVGCRRRLPASLDPLAAVVVGEPYRVGAKLDSAVGMDAGRGPTRGQTAAVEPDRHAAGVRGGDR